MDIANSNLQKVSQGMVAIMDTFDNLEATGRVPLTSSERAAVLICCFMGLAWDSKTHSIIDYCMMADQMKWEAKRTKVPEFGGAIKYVQQHLKGA